ncbi:MAG: LamG-like jellyroll fold domain-containing protein [Prolixibacteraceae bacterium]
MKKILILFVMLNSINIQAKTKVIVHFNFGRVGNISYAAVPNEITDTNSGVKIKAIGHPVFYADAPDEKANKGEGSILFNGKNDGFIYSGVLGNLADNLIFEVWVKALTAGQNDQNKINVVASNGNKAEGYRIGQIGNQWVLASGSVATVHIGNVIRDQWTHIAVVCDGVNGSVWLDGMKTADFIRTAAFFPGFSIGCNIDGNDNFKGDIYEIRCSTFDKGDFNPKTDFLVNYKKRIETDKKILSGRKALFNSLEAPGLGKEIVSLLPQILNSNDWLISNIDEPCKLFVQKSQDGLTSLIQLQNGLVSRTFYISDNIACVSYRNLSNGAEYIRAVKPEARIRLDSVWYEVGGLKGQPENSYLLDSWYSQLESNHQAFVLKNVETSMPIERYPWRQKYNALSTPWPAKGLRVVMTYGAQTSMDTVQDIEVKVNYEIYSGIPVITKWVEVINHSEKEIELTEMETEILAINQDQLKRMHVESDYSFALANWDQTGSGILHFNGVPKAYQAGQSTTKWEVDPEYNTWATQNAAEDICLDFPHRNLLISKLPMGPNTIIKSGSPFISYITFELLQDNDDRERKSLGQRRMYKKLAPQVTESLIGASITSDDEKKLKFLIDQMQELGMERLTIDPWPGISYDNTDERYLNHWETIGRYAKERGIIMAGYELQVASKGRGQEVDCIDPETKKPGSLFGQSVCIASNWRDDYYPKMWKFYERSGFMTYSADGPYHGDACASKVHKYHRGLADSQWNQWIQQVDIIHEAQRRGMYVALPDWYFLNGCCCTGMGYREASANLAPEQQLLLGRQYIYDGTWYKLPTMGWMTLQLVGFYSDDPRIGLEPLNKNIKRYEQQLVQYLASGCQLGIRGNRMYDNSETKAMVLKWINWFKRYRDILTSEIIHVSRPTGRDLDCILHVNSSIKHKGMVIVFNPTDREIEKKLRLPLYYTGLKNNVTIIKDEGIPEICELNEKCELFLPVKVPAQGTIWFVLE